MRSPFESYSRNREDVVLARALGGIEQGRYVDVGAGDPMYGSASMAFYALGWSGIVIESDPGQGQGPPPEPAPGHPDRGRGVKGRPPCRRGAGRGRLGRPRHPLHAR